MLINSSKALRLITTELADNNNPAKIDRFCSDLPLGKLEFLFSFWQFQNSIGLKVFWLIACWFLIFMLTFLISMENAWNTNFCIFDMFLEVYKSINFPRNINNIKIFPYPGSLFLFLHLPAQPDSELS